MAEVCFKFVKYLASPSGAYLEYMMRLPEKMGCNTVNATFLIHEDPETGLAKYREKQGVTPKEYRAWLTETLEELMKKMSTQDKIDFLRDQRHLL